MYKNGNISVEQYRNELNRVCGAGKACSVCSCDSKVKMGKPGVQKVQRGRKRDPKPFFEGPFRIEIEIHGKYRGDLDNITKGILDALNRVAYKDDRQCVSGNWELRKDQNNL